jgi:hypothetical protein
MFLLQCHGLSECSILLLQCHGLSECSMLVLQCHGLCVCVRACFGRYGLSSCVNVHPPATLQAARDICATAAAGPLNGFTTYLHLATFYRLSVSHGGAKGDSRWLHAWAAEDLGHENTPTACLPFA